MKTLNLKYSVRFIARFFVFVVLLSNVFVLSGCASGLGLLFSPGAFEKKTTPDYNLKEQEKRKILVWIECPRSAGADYGFPQQLASAFHLYMTAKAGFNSSNIILNPPAPSQAAGLNPQEIARSQGAGYVLIVHVDKFEAEALGIRSYCSGRLIIRAALLDTDLGVAVWPSQPEGKMIDLAVEMETGGRANLVSRLTAGAAHCTLRYLYPCDKLKFKCADERVSVQEAFETETF
ncbi:MAG TPA: hypothetical protein P5175_04210 [Anaerohalosphaeraceae bacterium]|nr:hypothetical protein [Phycisphaerae bacterium]HOK95802.1 hypothetical protein [Anaerohalosphaeraceae bacterium]HOM75299.1 hypothetical protein [Anaerohalosphaeraceae bacterium]HPC63101.1 hypothetical protein [Anaerohalosphaeraceae bacterium]HPO69929.1 hypothetical protein [Anaerohalosphaeraceae bacterium]